MTKLRTSQLFGQKHVIDIMMLLYFFGDKTRGEIYKAVSACNTMPEKLEQLEEYGILETKKGHRYGSKVTCLTKDGRKLAEDFLSMEIFLNGDLEEYRVDTACRMYSDHLEITEDGMRWNRSLVGPVVGDVRRLALEPRQGARQD